MDTYTYQLFDDITSDTIRSIAAFVKGLPDNANVVMDICSRGGGIFEGLAVLQMIQVSQKYGAHWTARVYGFAASTAADIVMVCDKIEMASTSSIMIHSAWREDGSHDEGIRVANESQLAVIHKRLPHYSSEDLKEDRWFQADEALSIGLCDSLFITDENDQVARIAAKYISNHTHNGGLTMDEDVKKEVVEEVKEEVIEEIKEPEEKKEEVDVASILDSIVSRLAELDERMKKIEEQGKAKAECGGDDERKDNARLKAVYERINAVCAPVCAKKAEVVEKEETPEESLARHKATYKNLSFYIRQDA